MFCSDSVLMNSLGHRSLVTLGNICRQKLPEVELLGQRQGVCKGHSDRQCQSPVRSDSPIFPRACPGQAHLGTAPLQHVLTLRLCPSERWKLFSQHDFIRHFSCYAWRWNILLCVLESDISSLYRCRLWKTFRPCRKYSHASVQSPPTTPAWSSLVLLRPQSAKG